MAVELIWIIFGLALVLVEFFVTGFFVVFLGLAAVMVGVLLWAGMPGDNGLPFLMFAALSVGLLLFLRRHFQGWFTGAESDGPDGVFDDVVGHEATVLEGFGQQPRGKVDYRGAQWSARTADTLVPGDRVLIDSRDGITLTVSKID